MPFTNIWVSIVCSFLFYYFFTEKSSGISETRLVRIVAKVTWTKKVTENLASKLLDGKLPGGGLGYISDRCYNGQRVDWQEMAFNMLKYWANGLGQGDEEDLQAALRDI